MTEEAQEDDEELYEHYRIEVDAGQSPMRLDKFLSLHVPNATRTKIQNGIEAEAVKVNDSPSKASYKVKPADVIVLALPQPPRSTEIVGEDIPLDIVYEDEEITLVNKPAGMVVHPAFGNWSGTLVNALVHHFKNLPTGRNGDIRPGLVHRIDKDTSGLLVIARSEYGMTHLAKQFADHSIERTYYALVWGEPKETRDTIEGHIGRSTKDRRMMEVYPDGSQGKRAVTHYEVLENLRYVSLVKCNLETGRTHQIRAHMKHIGHPIFGDSTYGGDRIRRGAASGSYKAFVENCFKIIPRQALHAKSLGIIHPKTKLLMPFDTNLPEDFTEVLERWRKYVNYE